MTDKLKAAAEMALEALEWSYGGEPMPTKEAGAIKAIRQALAEPKQTPLTLTDYFKKPYAYVDAVDRSKVYVAPERKLWLKEREDKEWREFHFKHQYDIPLYTEDYNYEQQDC